MAEHLRAGFPVATFLMVHSSPFHPTHIQHTFFKPQMHYLEGNKEGTIFLFLYFISKFLLIITTFPQNLANIQ